MGKKGSWVVYNSKVLPFISQPQETKWKTKSSSSSLIWLRHIAIATRSDDRFGHTHTRKSTDSRPFDGKKAQPFTVFLKKSFSYVMMEPREQLMLCWTTENAKNYPPLPLTGQKMEEGREGKGLNGLFLFPPPSYRGSIFVVPRAVPQTSFFCKLFFQRYFPPASPSI